MLEFLGGALIAIIIIAGIAGFAYLYFLGKSFSR
jgi:hypothetical protein